MGVWDHFYANSVVDEKVSTHYVNLPHYFLLTERPKLAMDKQYDNLSWFDLKQVAGSDSFHKYMRNYASWLINAGINND
jgi:colanic acid biosynthesis protein WcaH